MKTIDRESLRRLTAKINAALAALATEEGLDIHTAGGSFSEKNATIKIAIATKGDGDGGEVMSREACDLIAFGRFKGLGDIAPGDETVIRGEAFRVVGLRRMARSNPVCIERLRDGKGFCAPVASVVAGLRAKASAETAQGARG